jgi:hypothetical protein
MSKETKYYHPFTVPSEYFSSSCEVKVPYTIVIRYTISWDHKALIEAFSMKPGMAKHIVNWDKLELEMQVAANEDAKQQPAPYTQHRYTPLSDPDRETNYKTRYKRHF